MRSVAWSVLCVVSLLGVPALAVAQGPHITANVGMTNGLALDRTVEYLTVPTGAMTDGRKGPLVQGVATAFPPTYTAGTVNPLNLTLSGALRVDASSSLVGVLLGQGSPTGGQLGPLVQGAVTSAAPSYTTGQTNPLSLDTSGNLRVNCITGCAGGAGTNVTQFGGTNISTGTGASGAGIPRVTVSNDSTVILGTGSATIGALTANQSVNVAQINGITPLMGNGTTGTGSQRVTIASDNTAFSVNATLQTGANVIGALSANQSVNVAQIGGTATVTAGVAGLQAVGGGAASGAAKSGNPVQVGGVFNTTQPTVTTGQAVELQSTARGAAIVATGADTFNVTINAALPTGSNTIGALTANQSVNLAQFAGTAAVTGGVAGSQGVGGLAASGAAKAGSPVQIGGVFNTTQPTVTTGQIVESQMTARGAAIVATGVDTLTATGPSLTKGTQGTTGYTVQNLRDAGRTRVIFTADAVAVATTEGLVTFTKNVGGTATTAQTTYTVSAGKTLRVQAIVVSLTDTSTTVARTRVRLRENTGGACTTSSALAFTGDFGPMTGTQAAGLGFAAGPYSLHIPDGLEFPSGDSICLSEVATTNTTAVLSVTVIGFEY